MNIKYFNEFEKAKSAGLKTDAKISLDLFIDSFESFEEKEEWVKIFLEADEFGHKIRHELYEYVVFPVLLKGYENNDPWSYFWLAETIQNVYSSDKLHEKINHQTDYGLLKKCFAADSSNDVVRLALLDRIARSFNYAVHEWPVGVLYAPEESPEDFLSQIEYARVLDVENKYGDLFSNVEQIVIEDKTRSK